jgi:hypothetical protein
LLSVAALAVVGCGSSGSSDNGVAAKDPTAILTSAQAAVHAATSVHISGQIMSGGSSITLDLNATGGRGGSGTISADGLSFQLVQIGQTVYIKGGTQFLKHFAGTAGVQLFKDKWLKTNTSNPSFAQLVTLTNFHSFFQALTAQQGVLTKSGQTSVNGQPAVGVGSGGAMLEIATTGKPYPILLSKSGTDNGKITFTQWNQPVTLNVPAGAVDISQLKAGA